VKKIQFPFTDSLWKKNGGYNGLFRLNFEILTFLFVPATIISVLSGAQIVFKYFALLAPAKKLSHRLYYIQLCQKTLL